MRFRFAAFILGLSAVVQAGTITVLGTSEPWDPSLNPSYSFTDTNATAPSVYAVTAGTDITIEWLSAGGLDTTSTVLGYVDANGYPAYEWDSTPLGPGDVPADSVPTTPVYLQEVLGDFTNSSGVIVPGSLPFVVGDGPVMEIVPTGATQLQLGINDDFWIDNGGSLEFSITSNGTVSGVPEPGTAALVGSVLLLGISFSRLRRRA